MPNDGLYGVNGERLEGRLIRGPGMRVRSYQNGPSRPILGLVIAVFPKDDPDNLYGSFAEYNVFLVNDQIIAYHVPMATSVWNTSEGEETTLHAASGLPDMTDTQAFIRNVMTSDGDLVLVQYVDGMWPMITHCVPRMVAGQDTAPWHGGSTESPQRAITYNGVHAAIDKDGNVDLDLEDAKTVTITIGGTQVLRITRSGGATAIELGQGTLEKLVLGETFQTWWNANVRDHTHTYTEPLHPGATVVTGPAIAALPDSNLTGKVKAER